MNQDLPQTKWEVNFVDHADATLMITSLSFDHLEDLEKLTEMGFREGFASALENLDELLKQSR